MGSDCTTSHMAAANAKYSETETLAERNSKYFDTFAADPAPWPPWVLSLHRQIAQFLLSPSNFAWLGLPPLAPPNQPSTTTTKMLDYACGTGLLSRALKPHFSSCIGIDVSAGMATQYNETARELGLSPDEMQGARGDLLAEELQQQQTDPPLCDDDLWGFDMVAICAALHHVQDAGAAVRKLAQRLKVGGTLLVIDLAPLDGSTEEQRRHLEAHPYPHQHKPHPASHTVAHERFSETQMRGMFEGAGCGEVRWRLAERLSEVPPAETGKCQMFFARATRL